MVITTIRMYWSQLGGQLQQRAQLRTTESGVARLHKNLGISLHADQYAVATKLYTGVYILKEGRIYIVR